MTLARERRRDGHTSLRLLKARSGARASAAGEGDRYRTRFLADKYGLDMVTLLPEVDPKPSDEDVIDIEALIEDETDAGSGAA